MTTEHDQRWTELWQREGGWTDLRCNACGLAMPPPRWLREDRGLSYAIHVACSRRCAEIIDKSRGLK